MTKKEVLKFWNPETKTYKVRLDLTEMELEAISELLGVTFRSPNR